MLKSLLGEFQVGVVEVIEIPEDYLNTSDSEHRDANYRQPIALGSTAMLIFDSEA